MSNAAGLGGKLAKKDVSPTFVYLLMAHNWKDLSSGVRLAKKDKDKLHKDVGRHDIEAIQKDMLSMDDEFGKAGKDGYKLAYRGLLLLRMAIQRFRVLAHTAKQNFEKDDKLQKFLIEKAKGTKTEKELRALIKEEDFVEQYVGDRVSQLLSEFKQELKEERRAVLNLYVVEEGKISPAFALKKDPSSVGQMMNLRWFALRQLRRAIITEEKTKKKTGVDNRALLKMQHTLHGVFMETTEKSQTVSMKMLKQEKKIIVKLREDFKKLFEQVETIIKLSYKIFIFDFLLLRTVLSMIDGELKYDQKLMNDHLIPQSMGVEDMKTLEGKKADIKKEVDNLEKFILQLLRQ
jgi:hypothetical protein